MTILEAGPIPTPARTFAVVANTGSLPILASPQLAVVPFNVGDVFAGVGRGKFNHFSPTGIR